jgi:uncharacterized protein (TIGR02588 family)
MKIPKKNALEWAVFAASLLLLLGVAGFLAYDAVAGDETPPAVVVVPGPPMPRGDLVELPVVVENRGGQAAQDLLVEVTVRLADGGEATGELSVPLLPRLASEEGLVTVRATAAVRAVKWRVVGYTVP